MTKTPLTIRPEAPADRAAIATVLARGYLGNGAAAIAMLSDLREFRSFQKNLALVGLVNKQVVAFAALTPVKVGDKPAAALLLAPITLDPQQPDLAPGDWLETLLTEVARQGHRYLLVQGQPAMYLPHGFAPARDHYIDGGHDEEDNLLLVKDLAPSTPFNLKGEVEYPHA